MTTRKQEHGQETGARRFNCSCILLLLLFHGGKPHNWHDLARAWSFEPLVVTSLAVSALLFVSGLYRLWREAPKGRALRPWEALGVAGGCLRLSSAFFPRVNAWWPAFFSANMPQTEL